MRKKKDKTKFSFDTDFQFEILKYLVRDQEGGLVLSKVYLDIIRRNIVYLLRIYSSNTYLSY